MPRLGFEGQPSWVATGWQPDARKQPQMRLGLKTHNWLWTAENFR